MPSNKVRIQIPGSDKDNGLVRLPDFVRSLNTLMDALSKIDRIVTKSNTASVYFRITELKYSSPATVETEILPLRANVLHMTAITDKFVTGFQEIERGSIPPDFNRALLEDYKTLSQRGQDKPPIVISSNGTQCLATPKIVAEIAMVLNKEESAKGSVSGILEAINIHAGTNKFYIYPIAGAEKIECNFPESIKEVAVSGVGRRVLVHGELKYRAREEFPTSVKVDTLEVFPPENSLPTFLQLKGIAPNATGDLSSEDFVSKLRGE